MLFEQSAGLSAADSARRSALCGGSLPAPNAGAPAILAAARRQNGRNATAALPA